jgi:transcription elongation factor GreA
MGEQPFLTSAGAEKIRNELAYLKGTARLDMAQRLRSAIKMGDLSENADYHKAKEDQGFLEGRIQELEYVLANAIIVEEHEGARDIVEIGAKVTIQEEDYPPETFLLVGAKEASPREGKISNESPLGKALLGHRVGDKISVMTPDGIVYFKIKDLT